MRNVWLVIKYEIVRTIGKPSFWFMSFVFPLIIFGITFGSQFLAQRMTDGEANGTLPGQPPAAEEAKPMGYVDEVGLVEDMPDAFPDDLLIAYPDEAAAQAALEADTIDQYYLLRSDFYQTGDVALIQDQYAPLQQLGDQNIFEYLVYYNLTDDPDVAALLINPAPQVSSVALTPIVDGGAEPAEGEGVVEDGGYSFVPMAMLFIFFFVLTFSSGFMLRSVSKEKETRVMEVLLLSLRPQELMLGKILGLGAVALLQMMIWLGGAFLILGEGLPIVGAISSAASLDLPASFLLWAVLYFLFGYLTFASILGALGTLAPNAREANQFTFLFMLPLMIPLWLNTTFIEAPDGPLAVFLSLFPLTSPVSMVTRMVATSVPLWQVLVSLGLLAATTYGFVLLSARLFRADTLLSSNPLNWQRLGQEIRKASGI